MDTNKEMALMQKDMETLRERVEKMDNKLDAITVKLLDPDTGFVNRVNKNTEFRNEMEELIEDIKAMKRWREGVTWSIRILVAAVLGGLLKVLSLNGQ
tara:strand:- start:754 stop:1047 length:294 start_codon:yes stop_codon:yes gene_type:complete